MNTIFLQLSEDNYYNLVDALCFAINGSLNLATNETDQKVKEQLNKEATDLEELLTTIGEQAYGQLPH